MSYIISGIQQIGLGNNDVYQTWDWYLTHLGMDLPIFDEAAEANLMLPYTGGEPRSRHAVLALNYQGGGGLEIWQYTSRKAEAASTPLSIGDLGINIVKYKAHDVKKTYEYFVKRKLETLSKPSDDFGYLHFFAKDLNGNIIEITEGLDWYKTNISNTGGIVGCTIGVTSIDNSLKFYSDILGYDKVLEDSESEFSDFQNIYGGKSKMRRILLTHSEKRKGPFSKLLGSTTIELVQVQDREPKKVFENRLWGDLGYIHLCFDTRNMDSLQKTCTNAGFPFTVDSAESFDMGEAAGRFAYVEDPDGTLIEFVEAHKIPLMKKFNWYLDLTKRPIDKPLPSFLLWAMSLSRTKSTPNSPY